MILHVNEVEATWVAVTLAGFLLTIFALGDAFRGLRAARADATLSRAVREITAFGNVRREFLRLAVLVLLLSIAIPGLTSDRAIVLSPVLVALMLVPILLLTSTVFDTRERSRLSGLLVEMVKDERATLALESSVQENIALTKHAAAKSEEAIDIGNHSREALMRLTEIVGHKEDKL